MFDSLSISRRPYPGIVLKSMQYDFEHTGGQNEKGPVSPNINTNDRVLV